MLGVDKGDGVVGENTPRGGGGKSSGFTKQTGRSSGVSGVPWRGRQRRLGLWATRKMLKDK